MSDHTIFLEAEPDSTAILLLHSFTDSAAIFEDMAKELHRANFTVYAPTFRGHGTNNFDEVLNYSMQNWLEDGEEAVDFLYSVGYEKIIVAGLSLGGMVAVHLLLEIPKISAAGTFAAPVIGNIKDSRIAEFFMHLYKQQMAVDENNPEDIEHLEEVEKELSEILDSMQKFIDQSTPRYQFIEGDIFIAQGIEDQVIDPMTGQRFQQVLRYAEFIDFNEYKKGGHYLTSGSVAPSLIEDFLDFVKKV